MLNSLLLIQLRDDFSMKIFLLLLICCLIQACSTTSSDVRVLLSDVDRQSNASIKLFIDNDNSQLTFDGDGRILKWHLTVGEVNQMFENVAAYYGFQLVGSSSAEYILKVDKVLLDGVACTDGLESAAKGFRYSASVMTFGFVPASGVYCYSVSASLFENQSGELLLVDEFTSNQGRVDVYAGVHEVDNYQREVTRHDEQEALEMSIGYLFKKMLDEEAF